MLEIKERRKHRLFAREYFERHIMTDEEFEEYQFNLYQIKKTYKETTLSFAEKIRLIEPQELLKIIDEKLKNKEDVEVFEKLKKILYSKKSEIDETKIIQAREVPMERVFDYFGIEHYRGRAVSPFSGGTNPTTLKIKDNFYYCFATGERGNSIDFVMKQTGKNFIETVNLLLNL